MGKKAKQSNGYSSAAMLERRKRFLAVTRELVAEQGIDGFSVNTLCRRADVARQTLYNAFPDKETLMAAAILDYYEEYETSFPYRSAQGSLERLIERVVAVGKRNLALRNYIGAITAFHFSRSASPELRRTLREITWLIQRPYIESLANADNLQPWITLDRLIESLDDQRMTVANKWARGQIGDADFVPAMVMTMLTFLLGGVRGDAHRDVSKALENIHRLGLDAYIAEL